MTDEYEAKKGLAIRQYHFKWKKAKEMAHSYHLSLPYWERARLLYLELGGLRIEQLLPRQRVAYAEYEWKA